MTTRTRPATSLTCLTSENREISCTATGSRNRVQITYATHNYEAGMSLWEVQKLLDHSWTTTTVRYISTAHADPELASRESSNRAAQRLLVDKGSLR